MNGMEVYDRLAVVPEDARKPIEFGALKGKSDINPQYRIEAMTKEFGLCGIGWKFEVLKTETFACPDGQIMVFMTIAAQVKEGDEWSAPAVGYGGDFIIKLEKGQLKPNDEAYKMAETDALGNALKYFGVAASVYRGMHDSKHGRRDEQMRNEANQSATNQSATKNPAPKPAPKPANQAKPADKPADKPQAVAWTKVHEGKTCVLVQGRYYYLANLTKDQLALILKEDKYKAVHEEAKKLSEAA